MEMSINGVRLLCLDKHDLVTVLPSTFVPSPSR